MAGRLVKRQAKRKGKGKGKAAKAAKAARQAAPTSTPGPEKPRSGASSGGGADAASGGGARNASAPPAAAARADAVRRADTSGHRGAGGTSAAASGSPAVPADADVAAPLARFFLWADSPRAVQRLIVGLGALCVVLFLFDIVWHRHAYVPGEGLWGFHAIAGFVSFTLIVLGAKALRTVIGRDERYYGASAIDGEDYPERGLERLSAREGEDADELLLVRDARLVGERR